MFDNFSSIVWSTIPAQQEILSSLSDEHFLAELQKAFTAPVKRVSQLGLEIERMLPTLPSFSGNDK
jgi:2-polyprenyl-6-methoxyphenol hydroxylase-like FAD-dependent oxidoreductase